MHFVTMTGAKTVKGFFCFSMVFVSRLLSKLLTDQLQMSVLHFKYLFTFNLIPTHT